MELSNGWWVLALLMNECSRLQASLKRGDGGTVRAAADAPEDTEQVGSERAEASLAEALVEK